MRQRKDFSTELARRARRARSRGAWSSVRCWAGGRLGRCLGCGSGTTPVTSVALRANAVLESLRDSEKPPTAGRNQKARSAARHSQRRPIPRVTVSNTAKRDASETPPAPTRAAPGGGILARPREARLRPKAPTKPVRRHRPPRLAPRNIFSYTAKRDTRDTPHSPASGMEPNQAPIPMPAVRPGPPDATFTVRVKPVQQTIATARAPARRPSPFCP